MPRRQRTRHVSPPGHAEIFEAPSCQCGKPDSHQSMIDCDGSCSRWFHYDCAGINDVLSGEWMCLCCTIKKTCSVRVLRHIPKGARIQTAEALSTIIKDCVSGDAHLLS